MTILDPIFVSVTRAWLPDTKVARQFDNKVSSKAELIEPVYQNETLLIQNYEVLQTVAYCSITKAHWYEEN